MVGSMAGHLVMRMVAHSALSWAQTMALTTDVLKYLDFHLAGMSASPIETDSLTAASWACQTQKGSSMAGHSAEMMVVKLASPKLRGFLRAGH